MAHFFKKSSIIISVIRFGKILPLRQKFKSIFLRTRFFYFQFGHFTDILQYWPQPLRSKNLKVFDNLLMVYEMYWVKSLEISLRKNLTLTHTWQWGVSFTETEWVLFNVNNLFGYRSHWLNLIINKLCEKVVAEGQCDK